MSLLMTRQPAQQMRIDGPAAGRFRAETTHAFCAVTQGWRFLDDMPGCHDDHAS